MYEHMDDIAPIVVFLGCLVLIACGFDGEVKGIMAVAAGWICGKGYGQMKAKGGNNGKPV
jgi:hypothetical protein